MTRCLLAVLVVALACPRADAAPVIADAGKGIVFPYPASAPVVVSLNGYDSARDRLSKLLTASLPKNAKDITKLLDGGLDKLFEGRKLTGIRKDARAFFVLNDLAELLDETPAMSVLVPITTYKEFLESFLTKAELKTFDKGRDGVDAIKTAAFGEETTLLLVDLKEYVALTADKPTADSYTGKYTHGTSDAMGTEAAGTFAAADIAIYVNMDAINELYADQIKALRALIKFGLDQAQQQGALGAFTKQQIATLETVLKGFVQGVEDCRAVVLAAEFKPEGLLVRLQARFAENSPSAKFIAAEPHSTFAELAKLPAGLNTYQSTKFSKTVGDLMRELSQEFVTTEDDAKGAALIESHLKDLAAAGPGSEVTAASSPDAAITVSEYKDPEKAAKAISKAYRAVAAGGRVNGVVVKTAPRVGDEAEKHAGFTFSSVYLNYDFEATVAALPEGTKDGTIEALKRTVFEKTYHWVGTDGKVVVRLTAKDWDTAKKLLVLHLDGKTTLGAAPGFARLREQLPAEASMLYVAEVDAGLDTIIATLKNVGDVIPGFPRLGVPKKGNRDGPSYVGIAVSLKGDTATVTAFVPTSAITKAYKVIEALLPKKVD